MEDGMPQIQFFGFGIFFSRFISVAMSCEEDNVVVRLSRPAPFPTIEGWPALALPVSVLELCPRLRLAKTAAF